MLNNKGRVTGQREIRLVWNNAQRVNHQNKLTHPHSKRNLVPTVVVTKSGQVPVNAAKQSFPRAASSISTGRPVNTAAPKSKVNDALPITYSYFKAHSPVRRTFSQKSATKTNNFNEKVNVVRVNNVTTVGPKAVVSAAMGNGENVVKSLACWIWRPTGNVIDHNSKDSGSYMLKRFDYGNPQYTLQDQGIFDSGCSRHMTGNKSFLIDYQEIDGGFVAFGGSPKGVFVGNQTNGNAEDEVADDAGKKNEVLDLVKEDDKSGQGEATNTNSTNRLNTVSSSINTVSSSFTTMDPGRERAQRNEFESVFGQDKDANGNSIYRMFTPINVDTANLLNIGIFSSAYDDEDVGAEAELNNLETTMNVYRNKKDERGIVVRNKARLVAQGYTQEEGIDYNEVFAHVARIEAIMLFLAYASFMRFIVYQMDVKGAFLYGTIEEEVYVCQPPSFEDPQFPDKVYKVEKALYGLHQAPRAWYETLSTYLLENEFRRGTIDKTLLIKKDKGDTLLVQVYVDDIIFGSTKKSLCIEFESLMHKKFQMSSMGQLTFFLGLQVMQRDDGIFISQDKYVANILKKFNFVTVKIASTPIETNKALLKDEEAEDVDVHLYRSMIRSLMYLIASRSDIMLIVCACARFQVTPKVSHLHAMKRIFRYLKCQPKLGLWYPKDSPFNLEAFSDSDYAGASLDRKSTIGGCQFLSKRLISWQCKKQTVVANSTTEAE
ncbi:putative ribonuclease H-like domain-containing protein [Tanacetum coccineum]